MDVASNRKRGWHTTGVIGTFGAAAAIAKLMRLTGEQTLHAFGLAGTQSSGLWAFLAEGASLQKAAPGQGRSERRGRLPYGEKRHDRRRPYSGRGGRRACTARSATRFDMRKVAEGLGSSFEILNIDKKPYPCCRTTHPAIDAALRLRETHRIPAEQIQSILVETYDVGVLQCGFEKYPESLVEAKFSIKFTCAVALLFGRVSLQEFRQDVLDDPRVRRVAECTHVAADPMFTQRYPKRWGCRMSITLQSGEKLVCQIDDMSRKRCRAPLPAAGGGEIPEPHGGQYEAGGGPEAEWRTFFTWMSCRLLPDLR